ncbi:DUF3048 domain-containing protein [Patescibacteria group bacterium]|nr:DUF3048 domain-containing protein [Patescibacteria group bacterium]
MKNILNIFASLTNLQKILSLIIIGVIIYGGSASISYYLFGGIFRSAVSGEQVATVSLPTSASAFIEDPNEPKTESCPINGRKHTQKAKDFWDQRRPLAVMIENHTESRPQSGLSAADVVYEVIAEGGITRFMALYYCNLSDIQVGPVRSARTYFLDWLSEYDALYAHVGGANTPGPADALGQIIKYGTKDLNQFSIGFPVFWRDYQRLGHPVATEHTMYSTTAKLWAVGEKRGWTATDSAGIRWDKNFTPWEFKNDKAGGEAVNVKVNFWESQPGYDVEWIYDAATNSYKRKNGGSDHIDLNNNTQLSVKNVVVQFEKESNANDGYPGNVHLLYRTTGSGKALIFQDGNAVEGKWIKASRLARTKYVDGSGKEIQFNGGLIWIQTVPEGAKVSY